MSDAHPSLAPQWLKSGTLNLRPQTQSSTSTGLTDEARGSSWRESGSRLGLGAGADRDVQGDSRLQSLLPSKREKLSFPLDRGSSRGLSAERRTSYLRPPNSNSHRQLSDRELVEQMPALKLRPAPRPADEAFHSETSKPPSSHKDTDRLVRGRQQGLARKAQVPLRSAAPALSRAEKEVPGLVKPTVQKSSGNAGKLSPRHTGSDQPWTSRLTDMGGSPLQPVPDFLPSGSLPFNALQKTEAPAKVAPRMADTILQAQASAAQEMEAAKSVKARKEQLAFKQSKQLIPVISTKAKHASGPISTDRPQLTSLKKPSGLEALGRIPNAGHAVRRDEDGSQAAKSMAPSATPKTSQTDYTSSTPSPKAITAPGKPARERDRMTFFSSLRRKTSGGEQPGSEENGSLFRQASSNASETASLGEALSPTQAALNSIPPHKDQTDPASVCVRATNGRPKEEDEMTPEEIAFMRSLGWEDSGDDAAGGLTEEEVAAFKARQPPVKTPAAQKGALAAQETLSQGSKFATTAENVNKKQHLSQSFHSELEFSDSDSQ